MKLTQKLLFYRRRFPAQEICTQMILLVCARIAIRLPSCTWFLFTSAFTHKQMKMLWQTKQKQYLNEPTMRPVMKMSNVAVKFKGWQHWSDLCQLWSKFSNKQTRVRITWPFACSLYYYARKILAVKPEYTNQCKMCTCDPATARAM